jgi:hypothetical protein
MPYITPDRRVVIREDHVTPENAGELNFAITELVLRYLKETGLKYQTCNDIVGALDNAKDEFKRRIQDPYEDRKIQENGDLPGYYRYDHVFKYDFAIPTQRPN